MIDEYLDELGTLDEPVDNEDTPETSKIDSRDSLPELPIEDIDPKKIVFCKACKKRTVYIKTIDGECLTCAFKRLRRLESELSALHQLSGKREFCIMDGHREISKNKLFPDWNGKFVINGVELYPVQPLCSQCLAKLTTYFIFFLEERGILRRAPGHKDNLFGDPYNTKLTIIEENNAKIRLQKFIQSLDLFVLDRQSPMYSLYKDFRLRQRMLLKREAARKRKCQEENEKTENQEEQEKQETQEKHENLSNQKEEQENLE